MTALCHRCGSDSAVYDSRPLGDTVRRRRECKACGHRWATIEVLTSTPRLSWRDVWHLASRTNLQEAQWPPAAPVREARP